KAPATGRRAGHGSAPSPAGGSGRRRVGTCPDCSAPGTRPQGGGRPSVEALPPTGEATNTEHLAGHGLVDRRGWGRISSTHPTVPRSARVVRVGYHLAGALAGRRPPRRSGAVGALRPAHARRRTPAPRFSTAVGGRRGGRGRGRLPPLPGGCPRGRVPAPHGPGRPVGSAANADPAHQPGAGARPGPPEARRGRRGRGLGPGDGTGAGHRAARRRADLGGGRSVAR